MTLSRTWATPLTIGAFLLSAVTGVLMFFHVDTGLNKAAHEWLGWAMVAAVGLHAAVNGPAFLRHLSAPAGRVIVGAFAIVFGLSFLPLGDEGQGNPMRLAATAVVSAPVSSLGPLTGRSTEQVIQSLQAAGLQVTRADQSIAELSGKNRDRQMAALAALFQQ